ncbi:MAG: helix-turn-helix domain-containing protein [Pirellulales bacterium]
MHGVTEIVGWYEAMMNGFKGVVTLEIYRDVAEAAGKKIDLLEDENQSLNERVQKLEAIIEDLKAQIPVKPDEVDETSTSVLLALSRVQMITRSELAANLSMTPVLTSYYLDQLKEKKLVKEIPGYADENYFALSKPGRKFLFDQGHLK